MKVCGINPTQVGRVISSFSYLLFHMCVCVDIYTHTHTHLCIYLNTLHNPGVHMHINFYIYLCIHAYIYLPTYMQFSINLCIMHVVIHVSMYESIFHSFIHHLVWQNKDKIIYILILEILDIEIMHQEKTRKYVV